MEPDKGFLEREVIAGFRVWQLIFMGLLAFMGIVIVMCCFMRCRIPRTKQEIEADSARKKVSKQFSRHLEKIPVELMELEKVLPEVMTLENQRISKGIEEEEQTLWQKIKRKIICAACTDEEETHERDEEKSEEGEIDDHETVLVQVDTNNKNQPETNIKQITQPEPTDESCIIADEHPKQGENGSSKHEQPIQATQEWKKIVNVTTSSYSLSLMKSPQVKVDSPETQEYPSQDCIVDLSIKNVHGHGTSGSNKHKAGERTRKRLQPTTRPPEEDQGGHEGATRL